MASFSDLLGTLQTIFRIGSQQIANEADGLGIKNKAGTAYTNLHCDEVLLKGEQITLNHDATESGNDFKLIFSRNGLQTETYTITFPSGLPAETRLLLMDISGNIVFASQALGTLANVEGDVPGQTSTSTFNDADEFVLHNGADYRKTTWASIRDTILLGFTGLTPKGNFDPVTPSPVLTNGTGTLGDFYTANATGNYDFGAGSVSVTEGDWIFYADDGTYHVNSGPTVNTTDDLNNVAPSVNGGGGTLTEALEWLVAQMAAQSSVLEATINFNSSPTITFQDKDGVDVILPARSYIKQIDTIKVTPFNGTPTFSVGIDGNTSKYQPASGGESADLTDSNNYQNWPETTKTTGTETLKIFYVAGGATQGQVKIYVHWGVVE